MGTHVAFSVTGLFGFKSEVVTAVYSTPKCPPSNFTFLSSSDFSTKDSQMVLNKLFGGDAGN